MNIKHMVLSLLFVPSIMTTLLSQEVVEKALIDAEREDLEKTFKIFEKGQDAWKLCGVLTGMAKRKEHVLKVVRCLGIALDLYPRQASKVSGFVNDIVLIIFSATQNNAEAFANAVASLNPCAVKLFASIRYWVLSRDDVKSILERVMTKSPKLIIDSLPSWLASHEFDRNSFDYNIYRSAREQAFEYLLSFATERVLEDALAIANKNEHYKVDSVVQCCGSKAIPNNLITNLESLLKDLQARKERTKEVLSSIPLPSALVEMILGDVYAA